MLLRHVFFLFDHVKHDMSLLSRQSTKKGNKRAQLSFMRSACVACSALSWAVLQHLNTQSYHRHALVELSMSRTATLIAAPASSSAIQRGTALDDWADPACEPEPCRWSASRISGNFSGRFGSTSHLL